MLGRPGRVRLGDQRGLSYVWRRQDRIVEGLAPGLTSAENGELVAARKRIADLETELKASRRALELLEETADPIDGSRRRK